ncbi:MAG: PAS domain S-box protein, partial [Pseudomonadota bacterium]
MVLIVMLALLVANGIRLMDATLTACDAEFMRQAGADLLWQSLAIGAVAVLLTVFLLSIVAFWLTRDLRSLQRGVAALETGESPIKLPVSSNDEIGALTRAFNRMAQTLDERVEALKKSEARFHAIADYTFGVEAWFNPQGRLIWVNRSVERVTGYTPLECLLSRDLVELMVFEKDRKHAHEVALKAVRGSTGENFEVRLRRKDGRVVWVSVNWQPIYGPNGEYLGLRVSADEIQSRKEAELKLLDTVVELRRAQALKEYYLNHSNEERSRLEALLNVMKVGVLFVDAGHRVVYCNRPFREMWGFGEEDNLTGTRDAVLVDRTAGLCADYEAYREHLADVLSRREPSTNFEIRLKDGRIIAETSALVPGA